jgi:4-hydroxybenzoate polyprenyltransferase
VFLLFTTVKDLSFLHLSFYLGVIIIWVLGAAGFGYFVNDCFDIEQDRRAGKSNAATNFGLGARILIGLLLAGLALSPWLFILKSVKLSGLCGAQLLLFLVYSAPPVRFKERYYLGVITDALYAYVLPVVIVIMFSRQTGVGEHLIGRQAIILFLVWSLFNGLRNILQHHVADRKNDASSSTKNVVNRFGIKLNTALVNISGLLEVGFFAGFVMLTNVPVKLPLIVLYALLLLLQGFYYNRKGIVWNPARKIKTANWSINGFYEYWLILLVFVLRVQENSWVLLILPFMFILFSNKLALTVFDYIADYSWRFIKFIYHRVLLYSWLTFIKPLPNLIVNYTIYYYRRIFLRQDDRTARKMTTEQYEQYLNKDKEVIPDAITIDSAITPGNKIVNGLWIGQYLSKIELLTISSFIDAGHEFYLWVYNPILTELPKGVMVKDANEIIPAANIFRYKYANQYGHGKGSVSGFSDVFRYKLLYDKGGWWVDMDVTCLKPLNIGDEYFFRKHHDLALVGNVMKCPVGSELMKSCYDEAFATVDENNSDWHKPIEILNRHVFQLGLDKYIREGFSNHDNWDEVKKFVRSDKPFPAHYLFIHWMNEEWRSQRIDKNDIRYNSSLGQLLIKYGLLDKPTGEQEVKWNNLRHTLWIPFYERVLS